MKSLVYVRELAKYTLDGIADLLAIDLNKARECVHSLASCGVITVSTGASFDLSDNEDAGMGVYQFTWVGVAIFDEQTIICYPKYYGESDKPSLSEMRQVFAVLSKGASGYAPINYFTFDGANSASGKLALILALIESYGENGIYSNSVRVLRQNGGGTISWERTIAKHDPFISNGVPVYFEYETNETARDTSDFVARLHRCVLTKCSDYLAETGLSELFSIGAIELSSDEIEDFGDENSIVYKLDQERAAQFVTWKQSVIDMLRLFVNGDESFFKPDETICLGTPVFQNLWEDACQTAFGNQLEYKIGSLNLNLADNWKSLANKRLIDVIPKPKWKRITIEGEAECGDCLTLIPDVVALHNDGAGGMAFCIYDAKYYTPILGSSVKGAPGVESITKQILYQRAYRDFVLDNGCSKVINTFLVPRHGGEVRCVGRVEFPGVFDSLGDPFTDGVELWELPAEMLFECYLRGEADSSLVQKVLNGVA